MSTLRDFREYVMEQSGFPYDIPRFCALSEKHRDFWQKLDSMWNPGELPLESAQDVEVLIIINSDKWRKLENEFRQLPK